MHRPALYALALFLASCARPDRDAGPPLFRLLTPEQTGVTFANTITTDDTINVQSFYFVYNGAGVAVGDIDNDGLADLYFTGNQVSSRLYLNKGGLRFEDITPGAGVGTNRWTSGATMVDINQDGFLDIYVSVSGYDWSKAAERRNLLFINNGNRTFTEQAAKYGIADTSFSTFGAFLDYDGDRDLDLYLLNNSPGDFSRGEAEMHPTGARSKSERSYDKLYRNNGNATFSDVSREAGLLRAVGYGLGVVIGDVNRDGRPDVYVSNDETPNDALYINNGNGTFTDKAAVSVKHASFAGMGVDLADFNNDGWPDLLQTDMMPESLTYRKRMSGAMTYDRLYELGRRGFRTDYQVNTLQLSNGITESGDVVFSDIAALAGVSHTEWSWSSLFGDYDNDGWKDAFITNGYPKAVNDFDYQAAMFRVKSGTGLKDSVAASQRGRELLRNLRAYKTANFMFRNNRDLTFTNVARAWRMDQPEFSYGAAHADLDNDGDLDLVVNNIDAPAFVYENEGRAARARPSRHYLRVRLRDSAPNRDAIGAQLTLTAGGQKQYVYHSPYRGYLSTMENVSHFGLDTATQVDTLEILWPDRTRQVLVGLEVDTLLVVQKTASQSQLQSSLPSYVPSPLPSVFRPLPAPAYTHANPTLIDYTVQPTLHYMPSRQGPALATGDVNGDSLDDVFVGGNTVSERQLFLQDKFGAFRPAPFPLERGFDDWGAHVFDANGDGRLDLYVASGSYHVAPGSALLQDRLYINTGNGRFMRDTAALPSMLTSTVAVRSGDFTGDGRPDLFVGGRLTPRNYPQATRSYLLRNEGGRFVDVTAQYAPELESPGGMITDAVWVDFDGDKRVDLVTVGEWQSVQFYRNAGPRLSNVTGLAGLPAMRGWWFSVAAGDFDKDGDADLAVGNLGLNYLYTTSSESKFGIYAADIDVNRTTEIVLTKHTDGIDRPFFGLASISRHVYSARLRFPNYESFANASIGQVLGGAKLAVHSEADTFASMVLRNNGNGRWTAAPLPNLAQISPIKGIVPHDVDGDGNLDLIVAGNLYDSEPNTPRADAGNGLWLRGDARGNFVPVSPQQSGFLAPLNVTGLALVRTASGYAVVVANNGELLQVFALGARASREGEPTKKRGR
jgi:hypothetical protein